jgi:Ca2+-binding RTX toxin-like protein
LRLHVENLVFTGAGGFTGTGNAAANSITGGAGNDLLAGAAGDDLLTGGRGKDILEGGSGADKFVYVEAPAINEFDIISDFVSGEDELAFNAAFFGNSPATWDSSVLAYGFDKLTVDSRFIYLKSTGELRYDADGLAGADATHFVSLTPGTDLVWSDFLLI